MAPAEPDSFGPVPVQAGDPSSPAARFVGWRMVALAFLAQNCVTGLTFGIYGTILGSIQTEFGTSRALASSAMSIVALATGLLSPLVGELLRRVSVRSIYAVGALLLAAGYALLPVADNIYAMLAIYALAIGPAFCLLGHITASTLVSNWIVKGRGRALGLVNMPVAMFVFPPISAALMVHYGLHGVFIAAMIFSLAIIPLLLRVVSRPADIGQVPLGSRSEPVPCGSTSVSAEPNFVSTREILAAPTFWVILFGAGIFGAAGITAVTHIVPLAQGRGVDLEWAAAALSACNMGAAAGSTFWGWLVDRLGPSRTFVTVALFQIVPWMGLLYVGNRVVPLILAAGLLGFCSSAAMAPLLTSTLALWLGRENFSRAIGLSFFFLQLLPFLAAPVLAGYLFDLSGDYQSTILVYIVALPFVAVLFRFFSISTHAKAAN